MEHIQIIKDAFRVYGGHYKSLGDYSATSLINPPRVVALLKKYGSKVTESVSSQAASLVGTAVHEMMERLLGKANIVNPDYMLERGLVHPFPIDSFQDIGTAGADFRLVSGRFDILYKEMDLYDIKTAKTWKKTFDPDMVDWHQQQNIYAYLLKMRGIEINSINIVAFYLDWIESHTLRDRNYPQSPIVEYELELWSPEEQLAFILHRLKMHVKAETTPDDELPKCTMEERWEQPSVYAIMKAPNAKRAVKLVKHGTFEDALREARRCKGLGSESVIEVRAQKRKRCDKYCLIKDYCNQYQAFLERSGGGEKNETFPLAGLL